MTFEELVEAIVSIPDSEAPSLNETKMSMLAGWVNRNIGPDVHARCREQMGSYQRNLDAAEREIKELKAKAKGKKS